MKILIADDHAMLRDSLATLFYGHFGNELELLHAGDGRSAMEIVSANTQLDLILLDIDLPDINGFQVLKHIVKTAPHIPVISISGMATPALMRRCIDQGAAGFIPKTCTGSCMLSAIQLVLDGGSYIPREAIGSAANSHSDSQATPTLTDRQLEVLRLMQKGLSNEEIAATMGISPPTAKSHVRSILKKLGAKNRTEAVNEAMLMLLL